MKTPPQILWEEAGRPNPSPNDRKPDPEKRDETCCICGCLSALVFDREDGWSIPKNDTSQELFRAPTSGWVCAACVWTSKGRWSDHFRNWSVTYSADGGLPDHYSVVLEDHMVCNDANGGGPTRVAELVEGADDRAYLGVRGSLLPAAQLLVDPPDGRWFVVVAESGQKNLIRHAQTNSGGGRWRAQFELTEVSSSPRRFAAILWRVCWLRMLGATKGSIRKARPRRKDVRWAMENPDDIPLADALELTPIERPIYRSSGQGLAEMMSVLMKDLSPMAGSRELELALFIEHEDYRHAIRRLCDSRREPQGRGGGPDLLADRSDPPERLRYRQSPTEALGLGREGATQGDAL